jgi:beta-lactam-binding protein with PASTA domain
VQAFVSVTAANGLPISGLTAGAFTLLADGNAVASPTLTLPPADALSSEHLSVVFAMDYSGSVAPATRQAMEDAVVEFIASMEVGDYAAIVKSNVTRGDTVVQPFTAIAADNQVLINAVEADYTGVGTNLYDAVILALEQFSVSAGSLPSGPKAVIVLSDGLDNQSTVDVNAVLEAANAASIPLFTVGVGETGNTNEPILTQLAGESSGAYFAAPTNGHIGAATGAVLERLSNEYLLTFTSFNDCDPHLLEARVTNGGPPEEASAVQEFVRCTPLLVPDLAKQTLAAATTLLNNAGLTLGTQTQETSATVPAGSVIRHTPAAGTEVVPGSSVNVVLSSGPPPGTVPNVVGLTQAAATTALTNASLTVGTVTQQTSSSVAAGNVISQGVAAGQVLAAGSPVDLVVSSGPPQVAVPTVTGLTQAAATSAITGASLVAGTVTQATSATVAAGNVISQTPSAGTMAAVGSAVDLVVSSGPPPAPPAAPPASGGDGGGGGALDYGVVLMLLLLAGLSRRRRAFGKSLV